MIIPTQVKLDQHFKGVGQGGNHEIGGVRYAPPSQGMLPKNKTGAVAGVFCILRGGGGTKLGGEKESSG